MGGVYIHRSGDMVCGRRLDSGKADCLCMFCFSQSVLADRFQMEGRDDEINVMLNPAHALVCTRGENKAIANEFVDWPIKADGGQAIIGAFAVNDVILYSMAPAAA